MRHVDSLQRILECSRVLSTRDVIACLWAQTPLSGQRCLGSASDDVDAPVKDKKYVDRVKIVARAGRGGKGCVSFWRSAAKGERSEHPVDI